MTYFQACNALSIGQVIPYARADRTRTNRGSMTIEEIANGRVRIKPFKGQLRWLTEPDWNSVEQELPVLLKSGSHRHQMKSTRSVTYILSLRASVNI